MGEGHIEDVEIATPAVSHMESLSRHAAGLILIVQ
jgi:hypothetical protein